MDYLEDGKTVFRLRLRLCSSLFPVNERIRDFFVEYDRHTLHTSPPWGSELLEVTIPHLSDLEWSYWCIFLLWLTQNLEILLLWSADVLTLGEIWFQDGYEICFVIYFPKKMLYRITFAWLSMLFVLYGRYQSYIQLILGCNFCRP
jgi:hypothetical protein